ncbi:MAG: ECF transporter S component [Bacillota bacterium]|nr:ECF transporter S component [Bacillota bacterium]
MKQRAERRTSDLTLAGFFVCVGLILPFAVAHAFGIPGTVLLPMHIPVLLCGLLCGPRYGALCGVLVPVLSSVLTGMPPAYPMLPIMTAELLAYGLTGGLAYRKLKLPIYPSLLIAMAAGRVIYGLTFSALLMMNRGPFRALSVFSAVVTGLPGILIQLVIIPVIIKAYQKHEGAQKDMETVLNKAKTLLSGGSASCVIIRNGEIIHEDLGRGVSPLIRIYEHSPEKLKDAFVVDKIIGKAAAMILTCGGAKAAYGEIMSVAAKEYLEKHRISISYGICVDVISNRDGNGICPIEKSVMDVDDPKEGYMVLLETVIKMQSA